MPNIRSNHCYCRQDGPAQPVNHIKRPAIPVLPFPLDQSLNGEQFLLNDSSAGDISRILVFPKNQAVRLLANSDDRFSDGTFKVSPKMFFPYKSTSMCSSLIIRTTLR